MTDRPILFSAPMVRALLDGRKTQTRRIIKPQPEPCDHKPWPGVHNEPHWTIEGAEMHCGTCGNGVRMSRSRDGASGIPLRFAKGDRLWVRETWAEVGCFDPGLIVTRADYPACVPRGFENVPPADDIKWSVSIHMPRKHSRLTLTVTDVRVQRLDAIMLPDIIAEGISPADLVLNGPTMRDMWQTLWESVNGAGSYAANPWVVALTFTVEKRNIDAGGDQ